MAKGGKALAISQPRMVELGLAIHVELRTMQPADAHLGILKGFGRCSGFASPVVRAVLLIQAIAATQHVSGLRLPLWPRQLGPIALHGASARAPLDAVKYRPRGRRKRACVFSE